MCTIADNERLASGNAVAGNSTLEPEETEPYLKGCSTYVSQSCSDWLQPISQSSTEAVAIIWRSLVRT